jgi:MATE family multidrug resistance protein
MLLLLLAVAWPLLGEHLRPLRREVLAAGPLGRFVRLGAPIGGQQALEFGVFGAAGLLMGLMGTVPMASHQVALNLASLTFMVPLGVAQAGSVLVGQAVGRGDADGARRAAGGALLLGVGFMALTAVVFVAAPGPLARAYSADPEVVALAAALIPIAGVFQIFDGTQVVALGALRGVADTRFPMVLNLVGFWGVGLPVSAVLGLRTALGPRGVWIGLALGIALVAVLLLARVGIRFGRELRRVVLDDDQRDVHVAPPGAAAE